MFQTKEKKSPQTFGGPLTRTQKKEERSTPLTVTDNVYGTLERRRVGGQNDDGVSIHNRRS